jgi:hypothetical protein
VYRSALTKVFVSNSADSAGENGFTSQIQI